MAEVAYETLLRPPKKMVVHCKREKFDTLIDRSTKWGNPYTHLPLNKTKASIQCATREESISLYQDWIRHGAGKHLLDDLKELEGKVLGCWCKPKECHGDVLRQLLRERGLDY